MKDEEVFQRFHDAWTARDVNTVLELADPDIVIRPVHRLLYTQDEYRGHDGLEQWFEEMTGPWDSFDAVVEEVHRRPEHLVGFVHLIARSGERELDARVASICEVRDGRIVSLIARDIWDVKEELATGDGA